MLTTGNRLENGQILSNISFVDIKQNSHNVIEIPIRTKSFEINNIAEFQLQNISEIVSEKQVEFPENNSFVAIFIDPDKEPTKHIFADMANKFADFDNDGTAIYFIISDKAKLATFSEKQYEFIPKNSTFCFDKGSSLLELSSTFKKDLSKDLPVIAIFRNSSNIVYLSHGYKVGLPNEILKYLKKINN